MPRLKKFQGKPSDYSPKARLLNTLVSGQSALMYTKGQIGFDIMSKGDGGEAVLICVWQEF
jgi:hypothetical protein